MKLSVIIIGDEILLGQVTDLNSGMIARTIGVAGWQVEKVVTVGDDAGQIKKAIRNAMDECDVVITTGGLGPTKDDITKQVMLEIFGGELHWDEEVLRHLEKFCASRHFALNDLTRHQAFVPTSARIIRNDYGTAPVMVFEKNGKALYSLPGVPRESVNLMKGIVFEDMLSRYGKGEAIEHRTMLVFGITESDLAERLAGFEENLPENLHLAYLPMVGYHRLRLDGFGKDPDRLNEQMDSHFQKMKVIVGDRVLWDKDMTIPEIANQVLKEKNYTISTAESCTGGNIARNITSIPGSSEVFTGGIIAYSNEVKADILGIDKDILKSYGAVSLPVVENMVKGVKEMFKTDCAIATSGIAGPGGATPGKPVGTVCISVSTPDSLVVDHFLLSGSRDAIIERTTNIALIKLIRLIRNYK